MAQELFTEQGYDQTSLREIAQRLGLTKAALYYHFASKDEIFMALHRQLHEILDGVLDQFKDEAVPVDSWPELFSSFIDKIFEHRSLMIMHERNQMAFEKLHHEAHDEEHSDIEQKLSAVLADPTIPAHRRIRIGCTFAMIMGGLLFAQESFSDVADVDLVNELKSAVGDLLDWTPHPGDARRLQQR